MTNLELKALRERLGLTQAALAHSLYHPTTHKCASLSTITRWERRLPEVFTLPIWVPIAAETMSNAMAKVVGTKPPKAERKLGKIARAEKAEAEARAKYREQYAPLTAEEQAKLDACLGGKSRG